MRVHRLASRVWAGVKRNAGVAGNNQCVGEYLSQWEENRGYTEGCRHSGSSQASRTRLNSMGVHTFRMSLNIP